MPGLAVLRKTESQTSDRGGMKSMATTQEGPPLRAETMRARAGTDEDLIERLSCLVSDVSRRRRDDDGSSWMALDSALRGLYQAKLALAELADL